MNSGACERVVSVEQTLARISPFQRAVGVTRCADITDLDTLGIPVCTAIRPRGKALGVTNGKGFTRSQAVVGALMEALEVHHAETPPTDLRVENYESLQARGELALSPVRLAEYDAGTYFGPRYRIAWVAAQNLTRRTNAWVPASAAYLTWPATCSFSSNGLASGNDLDEATLHALLELVERDAVSALVHGDHLEIAERCKVVAMNSIPTGPLSELRERCTAVGVQMVLLWVPSRIATHTFWCALLEERPLAGSSMVRFGRACHLNPEYAALRAVLEAAQARLAAIHGAREDVHARSYEESPIHHRVARYFRALSENASFAEFESLGSGALRADIDSLLAQLAQLELDAYRVNMTRAPFDVPVVKMIVPGLLNCPSLF